MGEFESVSERLTVFRVGDEYLLSHYFEREDVFDELSDYYERASYRFEIPAEDFDDVEAYLEDNYYELEVVEDLDPYCVVKDRYSEHAEILRNSVANWTRDGHRFFLMKDELSVRDALERGSRRVSDTKFVVGL